MGQFNDLGDPKRLAAAKLEKELGVNKVMPYTYEFDDTEASNVEFKYSEYELLHKAYAALGSHIAD